jgi:hypothetical protein
MDTSLPIIHALHAILFSSTGRPAKLALSARMGILTMDTAAYAQVRL